MLILLAGIGVSILFVIVFIFLFKGEQRFPPQEK